MCEMTLSRFSDQGLRFRHASDVLRNMNAWLRYRLHWAHAAIKERKRTGDVWWNVEKLWYLQHSLRPRVIATHGMRARRGCSAAVLRLENMERGILK